MSSVALAPAGSAPMFQVNAELAATTLPVDGTLPTIVTLAGRLLVTRTSVAIPGPELESESVRVQLLPRTAGSGAAVCVSFKSAGGCVGWRKSERRNQIW